MCDTALDLQPQDVELIKQGKKENPTWVKRNEKTIKFYKCIKYEICLLRGDQNDAINWSCVNCKFMEDAQVKDLIIFRARRSLNKNDLELILKFEKLHKIKTSKSDSRS
jgi:hypothetical protein